MKNKFSNMSKMDRVRWLIFIFVRIIVLILIALAILLIATAKDSESVSAEEIESRGVFVLANAILMLIASFLPSILERAWKVEIPSFMEILFIVFCFLSLILGEIANFYSYFYGWDSMLHASSGVLITSLGFIVLNTLNKSDHISSKMSPIFVCIFAFSFSLAIGALWEIVEYVLDSINGTNMQRYRDNFNETILFCGREALKDTMKDIILDATGSFIVAIIGYIDLKCHKVFVPKLVLESKEIKKEETKVIKRTGWHKRQKK